MCLYPRLIKNRKYTANKKNKGKVPKIKDRRTEYVAIGCGKCIECMRQKANSWRVRLFEEIKHNKSGKFVTLTFSNQSIKELENEINKEGEKITGYNLDNQIATLAVRRFLERHRKKYKKSIRHWLVTELGHNRTENIHLHGILFTEKNLEEIEKIWGYGWIWKGKGKTKENYVNEKTINYITKYVTKTDKLHREYQPKVLTSKGIGASYINERTKEEHKYKGKRTKTYYKNRKGYKLALPTYYKNKIYKEEERERLWIELLDKNKRYVMGEEINMEKEPEEYWKLLEYHRKENKRLGYGSDEKDWERERYENEQRNMKIKQRIESAKTNEQH